MRRRYSWLLALTLLVAGGCEPAEVSRGDAVYQPATQVPAAKTSMPVQRVAAAPQLQGAALLAAFRELREPGVTVHEVPMDQEPGLLLLEVDLNRLEPVLVGVGADADDGIAAADAIARFDFRVLIGSGFVAEVNSLSPVGLLQINGAVISRLTRHGYTRVLGIRHDSVGVVATRDYHNGMFESALQVGPGIIEEGLLDITERDLARPRYFRTFIAACGQRVLLGASLVPAHLYTVGQRLLEYFSEKQLSCDEVTNLAGDREVVLAMVNKDGSEIVHFGHPLTAKASLLGFRRR